MESLRVPHRKELNESVAHASMVLDKFAKNTLQHTPWASHPYKPLVQFTIAHNVNKLYLKYYVTEKKIRATVTHTNGPVYQDSCVEFFVSFDNKCYYNLEVNCIGSMLMGYRQAGGSKQRLPDDIIQKIKFQCLIANQTADAVYWELTLVIPLDVFVHHPLLNLAGNQCRANFYKCGDALPQPHYLCWSNIECERPNFHLPQFFGTLIFQ